MKPTITPTIEWLKRLSHSDILAKDFYRIAKNMGFIATSGWDMKNKMPVFKRVQHEAA